MADKKTVASAAALALLTLLAFSTTAYAGNGNLAPNGPHFNLNLIGLNKGGSASETSNGGVIFVPLQGKCIIDLTEGTDFSVLSNNCVTGSHALLELPPPTTGTSTSGSSTFFTLAYQVWLRSVSGKGFSTITTCFTDASGTFCNAGTLIVMTSKEISDGKFVNVSEQLLFVCVAGQLEPIFSSNLLNSFWTYDNFGNHLAQLRFYPIAGQVISTSPGTCSSTTVST